MLGLASDDVPKMDYELMLRHHGDSGATGVRRHSYGTLTHGAALPYVTVRALRAPYQGRHRSRR